MQARLQSPLLPGNFAESAADLYSALGALTRPCPGETRSAPRRLMPPKAARAVAPAAVLSCAAARAAGLAETLLDRHRNEAFHYRHLSEEQQACCLRWLHDHT